MDRIEFIEELQAKIEAQTKVRDELLSSKTTAYNNSIYRLKDELASIELESEPQSLTINTAYTTSSFGLYTTQTKQLESNSTRTIIELGHELVELEKECDNLENDIAKYNNKSIVDHIPDLKDLVNGKK